MKNVIRAFSLFVILQLIDLVISIPNMEYEANPVGISTYSSHGVMGLVLMKIGAIASVALAVVIFKNRTQLALHVINVLMSVICLINLLVVILV